MIKKIIIAFGFGAVAATAVFGYAVYSSLATLTLHNAHHHNKTKNHPSILVVSTDEGTGGTATHVTKLLEGLNKHGYPTCGFFEEHSGFVAKAHSLGCTYYTIQTSPLIARIRPLHKIFLTWTLDKVYQQMPCDVVHLNNRIEIPAAKKLAHHKKVATVFTQHTGSLVAKRHAQLFAQLDAFICVNPYLTQDVKTKNTTWNLEIKHAVTIPPLFYADDFINFTTTIDRETFFRDTFGITISKTPIITMVGNFYRCLRSKNHPLLLEAMRKLIYEHHIPVQLMLAGIGPRMQHAKNLVKEKKLEPYVHFLGLTDQVKTLLYHSDVFVLSSSLEALGIVVLEAGLMKKPIIVASDTGPASIIEDNKTGLLFKQNNAADLALKIKALIQAPAHAKELGINAEKHIKQHYHPNHSLALHEQLYEAVILGKRNQKK